jgi:DNA-directed RNA polymerase specialized sigma24 family protein
MHTSAVGSTLTRVRSMVRRAARVGGVSSWPDPEREVTGDRSAARRSVADRLALVCSETQEVRRFFETLDARERDLFVAYFFEERKLSAIARTRGVSVRRLDGVLHDLADDFLAAMTDPATGRARGAVRDTRTGRFVRTRRTRTGVR